MGERADAPVTFFALVFALSLPFWIIGAAVDRELMPGLPVASVMIVCPALAAIALRLWRSGRHGALALLGRALDARRMRSPALIALLVLINPLVFAASYLIQRGLGVDAPPPDIALAPALTLLAIFLIAALCEELGWTGYALDPVQRRWGALSAGLIIGAVWAAWHFIPLAQADRSWEWIAWWTLWTLAVRVLMVWLYNRTGKSVFGLSLYHALSNVCWQLYPIQGSYFDPAITGLVTLALTLVLVGTWRPAR